MSREKKLVFDAILVFSLGLFSSLFGYLIKMILSRRLTLEDFGLFYAVFTFVNFFIVFKDFGLGQSLRKLIPQFLVQNESEKVNYSIKFVFLVNFISGILFAILFILLSNFLAKNYFNNEFAKPLLILLSIYFVLYSLYIVFIDIFVGFQKTLLYSQNLFLIHFLVLVGLFLFGGYGRLAPPISYLFAVILGCTWGVITLIRLFPIKRSSSKQARLKSKLFSYGFPLLMSSIGFIFIGQIDTLLLTHFRTLSEIGIYNVVLPTAMLLVTLGSSFALVILPLISEYWARGKKLEISRIINHLYSIVFILVIPISLIMILYSNLILNFLFGPNFVFGSSALKILAIGAIFYSLATINNNLIVAVGKPKIVTKLILLAALLNLILNLLLIPPFGIIGAALATMVAYLVILILSTYQVSKLVKIKVPVFNWIKTLFAGVIFILIVYFVKNILFLNVWLEIILTLLIAGSVYLILLQRFSLLNFRQLLDLLNLNSILKFRENTN